jgi:hypothetical protein
MSWRREPDRPWLSGMGTLNAAVPFAAFARKRVADASHGTAALGKRHCGRLDQSRWPTGAREVHQ